MRRSVTVIIPTFNRDDMLREALGSVASQTFRDFQVIVVDDGSDEDLAPIVASFGPMCRHLRVPHGGAARARNAGIQAADSDLVAFLDSDDLWLPDHLAATVSILRDHPQIGLVYHDTLTLDPGGTTVSPRKRRPQPQGQVTEALFVYDCIPTPSVVCRRDLVLRAGGFDPAMVPSEDYDLWLKMSLLCRFASVEQPLMQRRVHAGNISRQHKARNEIVRSVLKERFWQKPTARAAVRPAVARAVLCRSFYRAGRLLWKGGWSASARQFLKHSLRYRPLYPRALFWLALASCSGNRDNEDDPAVEVLRTTRYRLGGSS